MYDVRTFLIRHDIIRARIDVSHPSHVRATLFLRKMNHERNKYERFTRENKRAKYWSFVGIA